MAVEAPPNPNLLGNQHAVPPELSRVALDGVGVAAQHFYGGHGHFIGRVLNTGEHRLIVNMEGEAGVENRTVGQGESAEEALHNSLEQMRTLETVRTRSLVQIEMTETSSVAFTSLAHYSPKVAPSSETHPIPTYLEDMVAGSTNDRETYDNTVTQEGWQAEVRSLLEGYLANDPDGMQLVAGLKISSLDHLTPEQAVKLSAAFVQNVSKYSYSDLSLPGGSLSRADNSTALDLLREGIANKDNPSWGGNGVCRNIASNVKVVFEALKATQGELSMLNNTYAVYGGGNDGAGYEDKREDGFNMSFDRSGHAWNTFVTIDGEGSAVATIIDATWALGKDAQTAVEHLDRTEVRATAQIVELFSKSENKSEAFASFTDCVTRLVRRSATYPRLTPAQRQGMREYAASEYLKAAAQLEEMPEGQNIPDALMGPIYQMRSRLERSEVVTLFALDKAGGSFETERIKRIITDYDGKREVPLPDWKAAENLIFEDADLQVLAYDAVGDDRVTAHAEESGSFRARLRDMRPGVLPAFDPYERRADAQELSHFASLSQIHDRDPRTIMRTMHLRLRRLAGDEGVYTAIVAGRSDYDLAKSYKAITTALQQSSKA